MRLNIKNIKIKKPTMSQVSTMISKSNKSQKWKIIYSTITTGNYVTFSLANNKQYLFAL